MKGLKKLGLVLVSLLVLVATGCSPVDKTVQLMVGDGDEQQQASNEKGDDPLVLETDQQAGDKASAEAQGTTQVTLYFADARGEKLVEETREIGKVVGIARATVEELIAGPTPESGLMNTLPVGTELLDINVKENGLCIVSLSGELVSEDWKGAEGENLAVYSLVNTLTQFPTITDVQILVDNQVKETLAGNVDISMPLTRDVSVISPVKQ